MTNKPAESLGVFPEMANLCQPSFRPVQIPVGRRRGHVYFATDDAFIKIGHSVSPPNRVVSLRSPSGQRLRLLAYFPGYMDEEHNLHRLFAEHLAHGAEWFRLAHQIYEFIAKLEVHRGPLQANQVTINDVIFGRHIKLLEMPMTERAINYPTTAEAFKHWADAACGAWPVPLQTKAFYAHEEMAGRGEVGAIAAFENGYREWSGVTQHSGG